MDRSGINLYESCMSAPAGIPVYNLFGETSAFPDVIHCERIRDRARQHDWTISPHRHREIAQLFFMKQGTVKAALDGRHIDLNDNEILFIPALCVHGFQFRQGSEGLVISLPSNVVAGLMTASSDLAGRLALPFVASASERLEASLSQLAEVFSSSGTYRAQLLVALSHAVLILAGEAAAEKSRSDRAESGSDHMARFRALVTERLRKGWRPGDYASALAITPGHLNRICQTATGLPASRYIEGQVMAEACRMLAFTRMSVADIAYSLGYEDPTHFSRRFRVIEGQSPKEYRRPFGR